MDTFVLINRKIGNTDERQDIKTPYEMIIPIKDKDGTYKAPKKIKDYIAGFAFKKYLEQGETILICPNGGWNILMKSDHIVKMWQK